MRADRFRIWWLAIPILTFGNQICAKILAEKLKDLPFGMKWIDHALPTPWFVGIVICQVVSLSLWLKILSTAKISAALPLTASSYVIIVASSVILFHEAIHPAEIGGIILIISGTGLIASE